MKTELLLGISLLCSVAQASDQTDIHINDIQYCENIDGKLHLYNDDEQVYLDLKQKALIKAAEELYQPQLEQLTSAVYSYDTIVSKLSQTINIDRTSHYSGGLFTPCVSLKSPSITSVDAGRFKKSNLARVCGLNESEVASHEKSLKQSFIDHLRSTDSNSSLMVIVNDLAKISQQTDQSLYQLLHKSTDIELPIETLPDIKCTEFYIYPIEIFVASS